MKNYVVFSAVIRYFKKKNLNSSILSLKSKRLPDETLKPPGSKDVFVLLLDFFGTKSKI